MLERTFRPEFRDQTGMVHNRREFWERTFDDAYELAYQTYLVLGLRDAAALADLARGQCRALARRSRSHPKGDVRSDRPGLVENGHLIKGGASTANGAGVSVRRLRRRCADENGARTSGRPGRQRRCPLPSDCCPASAWPANTLDELEKLRDGRWFGGGYERTIPAANAISPALGRLLPVLSCAHSTRRRSLGRSRRTLEWLNTVQGGRTGAWLEEIPLLRSQAHPRASSLDLRRDQPVHRPPPAGCSLRRKSIISDRDYFRAARRRLRISVSGEVNCNWRFRMGETTNPPWSMAGVWNREKTACFSFRGF